MAAYSQDLRQRVIDCIDRKEGSLLADRPAARRQPLLRRPLVAASIAAPARWAIAQTLGRRTPRRGLGPDDLERLKELVRPATRCHSQGVAPNGSRRPRAASRPSGRAPGEAPALARKKKVRRADERDRPETQEKRRDFCAIGRRGPAPAGLRRRRGGANTAMTRHLRACPRGRAGSYRCSARATGETIALTCEVAALGSDGRDGSSRGPRTPGRSRTM